jgi:hypothetical protein
VLDDVKEAFMSNVRYELEEVMDSLATISEILFLRLKCMECNQCEPCGEAFMSSLNVLRKVGNVAQLEGRASAEGV